VFIPTRLLLGLKVLLLPTATPAMGAWPWLAALAKDREAGVRAGGAVEPAAASKGLVRAVGAPPDTAAAAAAAATAAAVSAEGSEENVAARRGL